MTKTAVTSSKPKMVFAVAGSEESVIARLRALYGFDLDEIAMMLSGGRGARGVKEALTSFLRDGKGMPPMMSLALAGLETGLKTKNSAPAQPRKGATLDRGRKPFSFIDLFAGIGGMRLAFDRAGGQCVFTSEWDSYPASVYEENFGDKPAGDITQIDASDIPAHDILVAGFPCQPFSIAGVSKKNSLGRAHGFECKTQGTLFFDVARIIAHHRPRAFLLENVKNLASHDKGNTLKVILETLREELGYKISFKVIDASAVVPQHRERIYIVGFRDHETDYEFPDIGSKKKPILADILDENSNVDRKYTLSDKLWDSLQRHAAKHKALGNGFGFGLVDGTMSSRTLSARYYKDGSEILIRQPRRNPRRLTPQECSRLMGFPDNFKISVSDTRAYKCFGNSVVVPVVEKLAKSIANALNESSLTLQKSKSDAATAHVQGELTLG